MYRPPHFDMPDTAAMHEVIRANGFATLVTARDGQMAASHLPFMLADGGANGLGILLAHFARANEHWQDFDGETEAMVVFQGVHGYITPNWYESRRAVPTWDYIAVHAYGIPRVVDDPAAVMAMLHRLVHEYEDPRDPPWRSEMVDKTYLEGMAKGIVAFEIAITRLEGKQKLGQNRPADQPNVADMLEPTQPDLAHAIRKANGIA